MAGRGGVPRGCAVVAWVVLAAFLGTAGWVWWSLRPEPQPDVAKAARSAAARAGDRAVTDQLDRQLDALRAELPWASELGTTVADVCGTQHAATGLGLTRQRWTPVVCSRTVTLYAAFDGDFRTRLTQLDAALAAAGWRPAPSSTGLLAELDRFHLPPGDPNPSELAEAAARPNRARVRYTVPLVSDFVPPSGQAASRIPGAEVEAAQAPYLPTLDDGTAAHDTALEHPSTHTSHYVDWQPYGHDRLGADAYPTHGAVLAVSVTANYHT